MAQTIEERKAYQRAYYLSHKEEANERAKKYYQRNKRKYRQEI